MFSTTHPHPGETLRHTGFPKTQENDLDKEDKGSQRVQAGGRQRHIWLNICIVHSFWLTGRRTEELVPGSA